MHTVCVCALAVDAPFVPSPARLRLVPPPAPFVPWLKPNRKELATARRNLGKGNVNAYYMAHRLSTFDETTGLMGLVPDSNKQPRAVRDLKWELRDLGLFVKTTKDWWSPYKLSAKGKRLASLARGGK